MNEDVLLKAIAEVNQNIAGLRTDMNERFEAVDERFESIDSRFESIDSRFEKMDKRFDAQDEQVTHFYEYVQSEFTDVRGSIQATGSELKGDISQVYSLLDTHTSQRATDEEERAAMSLQLDRLDEEVQTLKRKLALR